MANLKLLLSYQIADLFVSMSFASFLSYVLDKKSISLSNIGLLTKEKGWSLSDFIYETVKRVRTMEINPVDITTG